MKIAITGHRPNKLGDDYDLTSDLILKIKDELQNVILQYNKADLTLITGMALGIDTLWAKLAIENNLPFIAAIPHLEQYSKWNYQSRQTYFNILANPLCTQFLVTDSFYTNWTLQKRNEWMVDNCDFLVAVWDGTTGGTNNCVKYANKNNKTIIRINPNDFLL